MRVATSSSTRRLGGAAAWPLAARAQQAAVPVIGFLSNESESLAGFRAALSEAGYVDGRNIVIEHRAADDRDRLKELAADLVRRGVDVIVAQGSSSTLAAKPLTSTIPIVFYTTGDPVEAGLVASLNRPGGNVTGFTFVTKELAGKQLGLLREFLPLAKRFGLLIDPDSPTVRFLIPDVQAAAMTVGLQIEVLKAVNSRDIDAAFTTLVEKRADGLIVTPDRLFSAHRAELLALAARQAVPTIHPFRGDVEAGGLMSYGSSFADVIRQAAAYVGRILKGEKPSDLPVQRSDKFEFVINLRTAKTLGIQVPPTLLAIADEVIE
jgi:putative ABC transport system substrate-binding protein